jgi:peptide/nickel transport system permease protein
MTKNVEKINQVEVTEDALLTDAAAVKNAWSDSITDGTMEVSDLDPNPGKEPLALDDARRVKVLSPTALVVKRFFASRLSLVGLSIIVFIFLFAFIGGAISPYEESDVFYKEEALVKDFVFIGQNDSIQFVYAPGKRLTVLVQAEIVSAMAANRDSITISGLVYDIEKLGDVGYLLESYSNMGTFSRVASTYNYSSASGVSPTPQALQDEALRRITSGLVGGEHTEFTFQGGQYMLVQSNRNFVLSQFGETALGTRLIMSPLETGFTVDYETEKGLLLAVAEGRNTFATSSGEYRIENEEGSYYVRSSVDNSYKFIASTISMQGVTPDIIVTVELRKLIEEAVLTGKPFTHQGIEYEMGILSTTNQPVVRTEQTVTLIDMFSPPSAEHWLGTDGNGMDMMTRLMYGGRISLIFALAVVLIDVFLGTILGGISGFFGGWVDMLIMRLVDIWYCIPTMPLYIIIGVVMDNMNIDPYHRVYVLIALLGVMGWAGVARLVRGQILSLREQEFMVAAEALGIRTRKRIFGHLIPNVIPQLIVTVTMGVGGTILSETTLSFLGLGIKYPMASWGTILNSVNDAFVMTNYPFVWIPAGFAILITVLGFNFVGDGLRDAFDPRTNK